MVKGVIHFQVISAEVQFPEKDLIKKNTFNLCNYKKVVVDANYDRNVKTGLMVKIPHGYLGHIVGVPNSSYPGLVIASTLISSHIWEELTICVRSSKYIDYIFEERTHIAQLILETNDFDNCVEWVNNGGPINHDTCKTRYFI